MSQISLNLSRKTMNLFLVLFLFVIFPQSNARSINTATKNLEMDSLPAISQSALKAYPEDIMRLANTNFEAYYIQQRSLDVTNNTSNICFIQQVITNVSYVDYLDNMAGIYGCIKESIFRGTYYIMNSDINNILDLQIIDMNGTSPDSFDESYGIVPIPSGVYNISIQYFLVPDDGYTFAQIVSIVHGAYIAMNTFMNTYATHYGARVLVTAQFTEPINEYNLIPSSLTSYPVSYPSLSPVAKPTRTPTCIPSESPTFEPSTSPSSIPTFDPTAKPTPTAAPNSRDFEFVDVYQYINGPSYSNYLDSPNLYTLTISSAISSCVTYAMEISQSDFTLISLNVRSPLNVYRPSTVTYISTDYTVSVRGGYTIDYIGNALANCTHYGIFNAFLHQYASDNGVDTLLTAYSNSLIYEESIPFREKGQGTSTLTPAYLAITIVLVGLGVPIIAYILYKSFHNPYDKRKGSRLDLPVEPGQGELNSLFYDEYKHNTINSLGLGDLPLANPMGSSPSFGTIFSPKRIKSVFEEDNERHLSIELSNHSIDDDNEEENDANIPLNSSTNKDYQSKTLSPSNSNQYENYSSSIPSHSKSVFFNESNNRKLSIDTLNNHPDSSHEIVSPISSNLSTNSYSSSTRPQSNTSVSGRSFGDYNTLRNSMNSKASVDLKDSLAKNEDVSIEISPRGHQQSSKDQMKSPKMSDLSDVQGLVMSDESDEEHSVDRFKGET